MTPPHAPPCCQLFYSRAGMSSEDTILELQKVSFILQACCSICQSLKYCLFFSPDSSPLDPRPCGHRSRQDASIPPAGAGDQQHHHSFIRTRHLEHMHSATNWGAFVLHPHASADSARGNICRRFALSLKLPHSLASSSMRAKR